MTHSMPIPNHYSGLPPTNPSAPLSDLYYSKSYSPPDYRTYPWQAPAVAVAAAPYQAYPHAHSVPTNAPYLPQASQPVPSQIPPIQLPGYPHPHPHYQPFQDPHSPRGPHPINGSQTQPMPHRSLAISTHSMVYIPHNHNLSPRGKHTREHPHSPYSRSRSNLPAFSYPGPILHPHTSSHPHTLHLPPSPALKRHSSHPMPNTLTAAHPIHRAKRRRNSQRHKHGHGHNHLPTSSHTTVRAPHNTTAYLCASTRPPHMTSSPSLSLIEQYGSNDATLHDTNHDIIPQDGVFIMDSDSEDGSEDEHETDGVQQQHPIEELHLDTTGRDTQDDFALMMDSFTTSLVWPPLQMSSPVTSPSHATHNMIQDEVVKVPVVSN